MKTITSEANIKATASLQKEIDKELQEKQIEISMAELLEKNKVNETPTRNE